MRSLFSSDDGAAPAPVATGGPSATAKLVIVSAVGLGVVAAIMWPTFFPTRQPAPQAPAEQHRPPRVSEYQAGPPPASSPTDPPKTGQGHVRRRAVPTEMALYSPSFATAAPATTAGADTDANSGGGSPRASGGFDPDNKLTAAVSGATVLPTSHATIVRNPDFMIRAGDIVLCLPVDAQNSSRPGFTTCRVDQWFRSSNQRRGLLPPGSRFFGQLKSGISQGQERLGVLFTMIQTPWFDQPLAAPGADAMGRAGLDADINTFFWDRAGAVAAYALLDMAVGTGQNLASSALSQVFSNGRGGVLTLSLGGQSQSLAGKEFDHTINRPPEATRDWALPITVQIGQNLDFSDACRRAMQVDPMACPLQ